MNSHKRQLKYNEAALQYQETFKVYQEVVYAISLYGIPKHLKV